MVEFEIDVLRRLRRIEGALARINKALQVAEEAPLQPEAPAEGIPIPEGVDSDGIEFITECEGCELTPYYDQAGYLTVGVGHLLSGESDPYNRQITQYESDYLLDGDLGETEEAIAEYVEVALMQSQYNALASLIFNIGTGAFRDSTLLRLLNDLDYLGAADQFLVWDKITVDGEKVVSEGLANRREKERELFLADM